MNVFYTYKHIVALGPESAIYACLGIRYIYKCRWNMMIIPGVLVYCCSTMKLN